MAVLASKTGCGCISDRKGTQQGMNAEKWRERAGNVNNVAPYAPERGALSAGTARPGGASVYGCCKLPLRQPGMETRCPQGAGQRQRSWLGAEHDSPGSRREVARPDLFAGKKEPDAIVMIVLVMTPRPRPRPTSVFQTQRQSKQIDENFHLRLHRRRECAAGAFPCRQPEGMTRFFARSDRRSPRLPVHY